MFKSKPLVAAVAVAIPLSFIASDLSAAVLEEVMVTAQKREQSIQDVGIAITAYTGDQLSQLGWTNAQQVTAMAPGVTTVQPNGEANYAIAIRGVANSDFTTNVESPVALYVDEVYISQMSGAGFLLYDMDRVEILRGPQGTLFGRNATGGLVHYITKKPTKEFDGYIMGTVGDYDQYKVQGAVGGGNDLVSVRFSGAYNEADGYVDNHYKSTDGSKNPPDKLNNADDSSYRAQVMFTPTDDLNILLNVRHGQQNIDTGFFKYVSSVEDNTLTPGVPNPILDGYRDTSGDQYSGSYNNPGYNELETDGYSATVHWSFGDMELVSISDYSTVKRQYIEDSDASPVEFFNFFLDTDAKQYSQELRLRSDTESLKWVTGVYYLGLELDDENGAITDPFMGPASTPGAEAGLLNPYTSNLDSYSVFGEVNYSLTPDMNLIVGARWIRDERDFKYTTNYAEFLDAYKRNYNAPSNLANVTELAAYKGNRDDEEVSGRLELDYNINNDLMVYGSWNLGVRGGGYNAPIFPLSPPLDYDDATMSYVRRTSMPTRSGSSRPSWAGWPGLTARPTTMTTRITRPFTLPVSTP